MIINQIKNIFFVGADCIRPGASIAPLRLILCSIIVLGLTSCKINLNIFGDDDDKVISVSGNFDCTNNTNSEQPDNGDCTQQYVNAIADCDDYDINDSGKDEWSELPNCTLVEAEATHTDVLAAIPADGNEFAGWANFCWVGASFCKFEVTSENAASTSTAEVEANFGEVVQVQDAQYTYNHLGQRQSKTVNNVTTYFVYDADGLMIGEYSSTGATIREYVYLEGKLLAQYDYTTSATEPVQNYYINDHLGTPIIMMNREPEQTYDLETGPFGERYGEFKTVGTVQNIRFPGQYADSETGYSQNWNRDYDSATGRYLQSDPIGLQGGVNTYLYANANPVMFVDPDGKLAWILPLLPEIAAGLGQSAINLTALGIGAATIYDSRANGDPVKEKPYNPGKDCNGKCNPCKPGQAWPTSGSGHGHPNGVWHLVTWNQNPETCMCYPDRPSTGLPGW